MCKVNRCGRFDLCMIAVSLLAKGVDWNTMKSTTAERANCLPSCEGSGLKHASFLILLVLPGSPFLRREWIETLKYRNGTDGVIVSLLAKGVDWNIDQTGNCQNFRVSLLAKGVDWNVIIYWIVQKILVSLLAKGVDWNISNCLYFVYGFLSPFLRREWIETRISCPD